MKANDRQVGGDHYRTEGQQHWDVAGQFHLDYFQGQVSKYIFRWRKKNGLQDLEKAAHYLEKYIELVKAGIIPDPTVNGNKLDLNLASIPPKEYAQLRKSPGPYAPRSDDFYTYEGGTAKKELYRCRKCNEHFETPVYEDPRMYHSHQPEEDAGRGYINQ